jgi:hypothetical protein
MLIRSMGRLTLIPQVGDSSMCIETEGVALDALRD